MRGAPHDLKGKKDLRASLFWLGERTKSVRVLVLRSLVWKKKSKYRIEITV